MKEPKNKAIYSLQKLISKTIFKNQLIEENDRLLIALSGGKDSMVLLDALSHLRKSMLHKPSLIAVHISIPEIGYQVDIEKTAAICNELGVEFKNEIVHVDAESHRSPCWLCAWTRRKTLFNLMDELQCTKLAFGHHLDDANETLLMNMIFHGTISSMPYKFKMRKGGFEVIRPLLNLTKAQTNEYAAHRGYIGELKTCAYGKDTKRNEMKELINKMSEMNKNARINMFRSINYRCDEYLPYQEERSE